MEMCECKQVWTLIYVTGVSFMLFLITHLLFQLHGRLHSMTEWQRQTSLMMGNSNRCAMCVGILQNNHLNNSVEQEHSERTSYFILD